MTAENKDLTLKTMCRILYRSMGYCAHYEVKLRTKSYIETLRVHDISDIDVLGYKFQPDLSPMTIGAECKSGETQALDELYKFIGVMDYYRLNKGYFLKTRVHQNARQISMDKGILNYSEAELRKLLIGFEIDVDKEIKIEKARYYKLTSAFELVKKIDEKLIEYLLYEYWNKEAWRNIHNLIHLFKGYKTQTSLFSDMINPIIKLLYYYTLELFIRAILLILNKAMILNYSDIERSIEVVLYGSVENLHERRKLADLIQQTIGNNDDFEAPWQSSFVALCTRFSEHSKAAADMPNLIQDLIDFAFYDTEMKISKNIMNKYSDLTRKFIQDTIQFILKNTDFNEFIFKEFMAL